VDFRAGDSWQADHFEQAAAFVARLVDELDDVPMSDRTLLNVNAPTQTPKGVRACRLGRRIYRDRLELDEESGARRRYRIYGDDPSYHQEDGTDFAAIAEGCIAVTPLHFDLTAADGVEALAGSGLERLLGPVEEQIGAGGAPHGGG
jgi:5'-nucleotidase